MWQDAQKQVPKFCTSKRAKNTKTHPEKAKPGAFWVLERMETGEDGCKQMRKPTVRTSVNTATIQHIKKKTGRNAVFPPVFGRGRRT